MGTTQRKPSRSFAVLGAVGLALVAAGVGFLVRSREAAPPPRASTSPRVSTAPPAVPRPPAPSALAPALAAPLPPAASHPVDLAALRDELPDNVYWELAAPTADAGVLERREAEAARWNALYGRVLSGDASEQEVRDYYAHRRRVSEDYLALSLAVLRTYGPRLPERDLGLYRYGARLHRERLLQLPREEETAQARRREQEAKRAAWRTP